ncbi:RNA polymerase sigma factor [Mangrovibacterium lignilyticum]|uniref:RNA polymerase sigma factor n=1 Tax=Mangrovibacterium lignilyticum TaxID=2668052 RepID=UPI0013D2BAD9|nr:sigma-70 family RNA polymerase sigma factor [Mangrovibacterium lignilyticum]
MLNRGQNRDDTLVSQVRNGSIQSFRILYDRYNRKVFLFSRKYLREKQDAEDVLNEVFLKIWENRHSLKTETSFQSYLFTIAYNNIRKRYLKKSKEEENIRKFASEYVLETSGDEEQLDYNLFIRKLDKLAAQLPDRRKEIFLLRYRQDLKNKEIAQRLDLTEQFVKNQLSIARKYMFSAMTSDREMQEFFLFFLFLH